MLTALEIGKKIKEYFYEAGISQIEVARILDVQPAAVSNQLNGRTFGKNSAAKWSNAFGFRTNWLLTGEGPMFDPQDQPHTDGLTEEHPELNHEDDIPVVPARLFRAPDINTYEYVMNSASVDRLPRGSDRLSFQHIHDIPWFPASLLFCSQRTLTNVTSAISTFKPYTVGQTISLFNCL